MTRFRRSQVFPEPSLTGTSRRQNSWGALTDLERDGVEYGIPISITPLNYAARVVATSSSARNMINTLFRCFVIQNSNVYVRLYETIIVPRLMYCLPVRRPYLIKYVRLLEGVQRYFLRRLAFRCDFTRTLPVVPELSTLFNNYDTNTLLCILRDGSLSHYISVETHNRRNNVHQARVLGENWSLS